MAKARIAVCIGAESSFGALLSPTTDMARSLPPWLVVMPSAPETRSALSEATGVEEVWVTSGDEVGAINLAAACKVDDPAKKVYLVQGEATGSVRSRMHAAALDGIRSVQDFAALLQGEGGMAPSKERPEAKTTRSGEGMSGGEEAPSAKVAVPADLPGIGAGASSAGALAASAATMAVSSGHGEPSLRGRAVAAPTPLGTSSRIANGTSSAEGVHGGFLFTVVSGSGGAGKSTVSTLAAHLACRRGLRTALLDADLQFGDLGELTGDCARVPVEEVARDASALSAVRDEPLVLIEAPRRLEAAEVVAASLGEVIDELLAQFDFVAVNTGAGWDEQRLMLLERSVTSLFLVDQRASSVRACRHALDLCLRCGVATSSFLLAANRCSRQAPFTSIDVSSALHGAHVAELSEGGREVEELLGAGMAEVLVASRNPLCASIDRLLDETMPSSGRGALSEGSALRAATQRGLRMAAPRDGSRRRGRGEPGGRRRGRKEAKRTALSGVAG